LENDSERKEAPIAPTPEGVGEPTETSALSKIMPCVYILKSLRDGRYYIGSTVDLRIRLKHHLGGYTPSTRRFGEIELMFYQNYSTLKQARQIEKRLKKLKRKDYIDKIVKDGFIKMN